MRISFGVDVGKGSLSLSLVERVVRHLRVGIEDVAEATVVAGEEHHQTEFHHESRNGDDGQEFPLRPVPRDVVDVDLRVGAGLNSWQVEVEEVLEGKGCFSFLDFSTHLSVLRRCWTQVVGRLCYLLSIHLGHVVGDSVDVEFVGHFQAMHVCREEVRNLNANRLLGIAELGNFEPGSYLGNGGEGSVH